MLVWSQSWVQIQVLLLSLLDELFGDSDMSTHQEIRLRLGITRNPGLKEDSNPRPSFQVGSLVKWVVHLDRKLEPFGFLGIEQVEAWQLFCWARVQFARLANLLCLKGWICDWITCLLLEYLDNVIYVSEFADPSFRTTVLPGGEVNNPGGGPCLKVVAILRHFSKTAPLKG